MYIYIYIPGSHEYFRGIRNPIGCRVSLYTSIYIYLLKRARDFGFTPRVIPRNPQPHRSKGQWSLRLSTFLTLYVNMYLFICSG